MTSLDLPEIDRRAHDLGIDLAATPDGPLDRCARVGRLYLTSGHTSATRGTLGADLDVEAGRVAAAESVRALLANVYAAHGSFEGLRMVRMLTCVRATADFGDHPQVADGASAVVRELFGPTLGHHARSALGFASLPKGAAVEIEAVLEIV